MVDFSCRFFKRSRDEKVAVQTEVRIASLDQRVVASAVLKDVDAGSTCDGIVIGSAIDFINKWRCHNGVIAVTAGYLERRDQMVCDRRSIDIITGGKCFDFDDVVGRTGIFDLNRNAAAVSDRHVVVVNILELAGAERKRICRSASADLDRVDLGIEPVDWIDEFIKQSLVVFVQFIHRDAVSRFGRQFEFLTVIFRDH